ncbi:MAG: hypothetical protein M0D57_01875 [Sphingobacteriales bacterium JAD_PAG50586_3]|nr:MAG: hypothetical protein M0D57_01875 [Sphingobacteriales bacterium JAD_PAG50586_3]
MKSIKVLVIAVFAAIACAFSGADATNPKGLGEKVMATFKKRDLTSYASYYITPAELKEQLKNLPISNLFKWLMMMSLLMIIPISMPMLQACRLTAL